MKIGKNVRLSWKTYGFVLLVVTTAVLIAMAACKNTPSTPTTPATTTSTSTTSTSTTTTTAPVVQSITVNSSSDLMFIGTSENFTATAIMSDGSSKAVVGGVWQGDYAPVATVEASTGKVTIIGSGKVTIFVDYEGKRGNKLMRGLPNYQGAWSGSYYIVSCADTHDFSSNKFCSNFPTNQVFPCNLNLIQSRDTVQGTYFLGTLSASASGPIQNDGQLLLTGTIIASTTSISVQWTMQSTTPGRITGYLYQIWNTSGMSGDGRVTCNIRDLNRTSTVGMGLSVSAPREPNPTLQSLIRAIIHR